MKKIILFIILFLAMAFPVYAAYPSPTGYVNDFAGVLKPATRKALNLKLSNYKKTTTNEVTVVIIKSLGDQALEDYSIGLADQWKPGVKGKDNGVIFLIAIQDRKMRIEVGRGLEGNLTDVQSQHILDDIVKPQFRDGNYDQGVTDGVNSIISTLNTPQASTSASSNASDNSGVLSILFILLIIGVIGFAVFLLHDGSGSSDSEISDDSSDDFSNAGAIAGGAILGSAMAGRSSDDSDSSDESSDSDDSSTSSSSDSSDDEGGFGGFGGGSFSGGGASSGW